jgi:hypothetical protein
MCSPSERWTSSLSKLHALRRLQVRGRVAACTFSPRSCRGKSGGSPPWTRLNAAAWCSLFRRSLRKQPAGGAPTSRGDPSSSIRERAQVDGIRPAQRSTLSTGESRPQRSPSVSGCRTVPSRFSPSRRARSSGRSFLAPSLRRAFPHRRSSLYFEAVGLSGANCNQARRHAAPAMVRAVRDEVAASPRPPPAAGRRHHDGSVPPARLI